MRLMTSSLRSTLTTVLATAEQLQQAGAANEANTRVHVIEPLLVALGWSVNNFAEVDREFKVYDGTFLDYALRIDGKPRLFVEAKALNKPLTDKGFIAQTINYANNEGVVWCVLTNGFVYKVYKSNEPVGMENKLLFEIDLREAGEEGGVNAVVNALEALRKDSVAAGRLDLWGEHVFTDVRVRAALATLATNAPQPLVDAVAAIVEGPELPPNVLKESRAVDAPVSLYGPGGRACGKPTAGIGRSARSRCARGAGQEGLRRCAAHS